MSMNGKFTYRFLPTEEWERLKGLGPHDEWIPSPAIGSVIVAEHEGKIVGLACLQLIMHIEPVWIATEERSGVVGPTLWNHAVESLKGIGIKNFLTFSDNDEVSGYLERLGMQRLNLIPFTGGL